MKAIIYHKYGTPNNFKIEEVEGPIPKDDEVLLKVRATSINSWDWDLLRGRPFIVRMWGLFRPGYKILGADVSGVVEAIGKSITKFKMGDEVFGDMCESGWGGLAEFTCVKETALALKSHSMSFEEAAAIPQAGLLALQGVEYRGEIQPGQKVLINGAGGGVGTFALQIAKARGAEVTCVDHRDKLEMLTKLGADHVIDFEKEDFAKNGKQYDLILDVVVKRSPATCRRALTPDGVYVIVGGLMRIIFPVMFFGARQVKLLVHKPNEGLKEMVTRFESGKVKPVIDRIFSLEDTVEAFRYFGTGNVKGKVVIALD